MSDPNKPNANSEQRGAEARPTQDGGDADPTLGLTAHGIDGKQRDLSGLAIGDYQIEELVGTGGYGQVYKAVHRHMGRTVAIKFLTHETSASTARFQREVKAAAKLMHPQIVTAFDAGDDHNLPFLVMEFVDGQTLFQLVKQSGALSVERAAELILQTAKGLAYAHGQGVIHRDIKPSNLMIDASGQLKILDMGIARISESRQIPGLDVATGKDLTGNDLTAHGSFVGTAGYISPEQIANARHVDHRTDIYSLACTLHFLLSGEPPFAGSDMETLVGHARDPAPNLCQLRAEIPEALNLVFQQMMAKDPTDRMQSMEDVVASMMPFIDGSETRVPNNLITDSPASLQGNRAVNRQENMGTIAAKKAVGFDIGTSAAYVSWIGEDGIPVGIPMDGDTAIPSSVRFQDGEFTIGNEAIKSIATDGPDIADRFICHMGQDTSAATLGDETFPYELLAGVIARQLADNAQKEIGYFKRVAYTVPGCFGDLQRHAYADAFRIAYLDSLPPVNAATAVLIHHGFLNGWFNPRRPVHQDQNVLVFRFGAGSFDATVFQLSGRGIATRSIVGDATLGGSIWDDRILQCVADQLQNQSGIDVRSDPTRMLMLRRHCETGKVAPTDQGQIPFRIQMKGKPFEGVLSRSFVNKLGRDLVLRVREITNRALSVAGLRWEELDLVLMAGGTSRMPIVRQSVEKWAGRAGIIAAIDSSSAPGGAALYSKLQIDGPTETLEFALQEVTCHHFGIRGTDRRTGETRTSVVIPTNTPLPATEKGTFRTSKPGQTSMALKIVEGNGEEDDRLVGQCLIENLPPGQPSGSPVEVEFHVAEDGTLSIFVESIATGRRSSLEIQRVSGLRTEDRNRWRDWLYTGGVCF